MKRLCVILTLFAIAFKSAGQKTVSEGTFVYSISIESAGKENASSPLSGATNTIAIKGPLTRTDMVSSLGNERTIHDTRTGSAVILKEYSGQKLMITLTKENWLEKNKQSEGIQFSDLPENKEILGYKCTKAKASMADGSSLTVFYTKDLLVQNREFNPLFRNLAGTPMEYSVETGNLRFNYVISKIDFTTLPQSRFEIPKSGYRVISYDDNKQSTKTKAVEQ